MKRALIIIVVSLFAIGCATLPEGAERIRLDDGTELIVTHDEFTGTTWTTVSVTEVHFGKNTVSTVEFQHAQNGANEWLVLEHKMDRGGGWYFLETGRWLIDDQRGQFEHINQDRRVLSGSRVLEFNWFSLNPRWIEQVLESDEARLSFRGDRGSLEVTIDEADRATIASWYAYVTAFAASNEKSDPLETKMTGKTDA